MNHFYRRLEAEKIITNLAQDFSHSYHLGVFLCSNCMKGINYVKGDAKIDYKLYSASEAKRISENRINKLLNIK